MTRYIEISTIGVSKDSQLRAAKILQTLSDQYNTTNNAEGQEKFFDYSYNVMLKRWKELRAAVDNNEKFSLPKFSPDNCTFRGQSFEPQPGNCRPQFTKLILFFFGYVAYNLMKI